MVKLVRPERVVNHGSLRLFRMPGEKGTRVIVFPNCDVPLSHLVSRNWTKPCDVGQTRQVGHVDVLVNGTHVNLFLKTPEHYLSVNPEKLGRGVPWHARYEHTLRVDNEAVEKMAHAEAKVLLAIKSGYLFSSAVDKEHLRDKLSGHSLSKPSEKDLDTAMSLERSESHAFELSGVEYRVERRGSRFYVYGPAREAEKPLALIISADGRRQLVTRGVESMPGASPFVGQTYGRRVADYIRSLFSGLDVEADDLEEHNLVEGEGGKPHIIDVNRWRWPGLTDKYYKALLKAIRAELEKRWERGTG